MGEHTQLPWKNVGARIISSTLPRDGMHMVCSMTVINNDAITAAANANLIVKAVNNHEALIDNLRRLAIRGCDDAALELIHRINGDIHSSVGQQELTHGKGQS